MKILKKLLLISILSLFNCYPMQHPQKFNPQAIISDIKMAISRIKNLSQQLLCSQKLNEIESKNSIKSGPGATSLKDLQKELDPLMATISMIILKQIDLSLTPQT